MTTNRPLKVFLCHSSADKPAVRELYQKLRAEPWIEPWLDEEELFPGMDWNLEIEKAIEATDVILVCLSNNSITKEGYVQREIRIALDYADYKPEGTLFIIPVRLEECTPPKRLARWQYADYFEGQRGRAIERLLFSLKKRASTLVSDNDENKSEVKLLVNRLHEVNTIMVSAQSALTQNRLSLSNGMEFVRVFAGKFIMGSDNGYDSEKPQHIVDIPYDYWIARYTLTNELYNAYIKSRGIKHPIDDWERKKDYPVTYVNWKDAMMYCKWLNSLLQVEIPAGLTFRLPIEAEWEKAARGTDGYEYPWGNTFDKNKCNTEESRKDGVMPIGSYSPHGDSPFKCADMSGNVWEWTRSLKKDYPYKIYDNREDERASGRRVLRGGSFTLGERYARCTFRYDGNFDLCNNHIGFRVALAPPLPMEEAN